MIICLPDIQANNVYLKFKNTISTIKIQQRDSRMNISPSGQDD